MEEPKGSAYDGPSGIGRDSVWLTQEDLIEGKDVTVKIENVILYPKVKFQGGRERKNYLGLKFAGKDRVLGVNATARKLLNRMFGSLVRGWKGNEITLFVSECELAGETVKCIRIRDRGARAATAAEQFLVGDDEPHVTNGAVRPDADGEGSLPTSEPGAEAPAPDSSPLFGR